jgi:hypothetical protein
MEFLISKGVNLLSLVFVDGSNNAKVIGSDDELNYSLQFSHLHHHQHHE